MSIDLIDEIQDHEEDLRLILKERKKKHIIKEGSRRHVLYWNTNGKHCSEPDCEINQEKKG